MLRLIRRIVPVALTVAGLAAGLGAGFLLRPDAPMAAESAAAETDAISPAEAADADAPLHEYVKLNNQFVVPVVEDGRVAAVVVLSLSLEVKPGMTERVYDLEPKLRDGLLQVLFDHANAGGFSGAFTEGANLTALRRALKETAGRIFGKDATDVLISDLVRQDN